MSATREALLEQIIQIEETIKRTLSEGFEPTTALRTQLVELNKQFAAINQALTEGSLIKG